jgi:kinesin family protein 5
LIAFGLTGTGKEYALLGGVPRIPVKKSDDDSTHKSSEIDELERGIAPRIIYDLFAGIREFPDMIEFKVTCSFVGIYLEKIYDLLEPCIEKTIFVRETVAGVELEGASQAFCFDEDDFIMVLHRGSAANSLLAARMRTDANKTHMICVLNFEQRNIVSKTTKRSYLQFTMIGGFDFPSKSKSQSAQEGKVMQKSFTTFDQVVKAVSEGEANAPFRDSKLTSILKDAIGGNCKTSFIITASPSSYSISDTVNAVLQGKRMRRIVNFPCVNRDASLDDYRKWLLENESKLNELTGLIRWYSALVEENNNGSHKASAKTNYVWQSIEAIVSNEELNGTPFREALIFGDADGKLKGNAKYQVLALEFSKKISSEAFAELTTARDRAESLLSDLQSEVIVLRRQNELLSQEQQKKDSDAAASNQENRLIVLRNSDLEHQLNLAKSRAAEAVVFLCYLRALCWWLKKDSEKDRPVELREILYEISGTPDLTGLVDLDFILVDANIIENVDVGVENIEERFADYLLKAGLVHEEQKVFFGSEPDEISDVTGETTSRASFARRGDVSELAPSW